MNEDLIIKEASNLEFNKRYLKEKKGKKISNEQYTRAYILDLAKLQGCYPEAKKIMDRYDMLLTRCDNPVEKKHISIMGIAELHKLLNVQGALVVNGVEILPAIGKIRDIVY